MILDSGTHYNRYRDYDPATGRYLTSDPIGLEGGFNTYAYAEGLPNILSDVLGLDTGANSGTPDIQKPGPSFESKLVYVLEHVKQKLGEDGIDETLTKFFDDLKTTATLMAGIAAAAGVALGVATAATAATGGAALPVAVGALASAASAVGVAALWATGFQGVKFLYDVISIGVSIYGTPNTDCASLKSSADQLADKITSLGSEVLGNVVGFGVAGIVRKLSDVFKLPNIHGRCSFDGDTQVLAYDGYKPIKDIRAGHDQVWSRNEYTGENEWKSVLAQYSNTYDETVHTTVEDGTGKRHTLVSNRIHPFFARLAAGVLLTVAAEGHIYAGEIENGAWVDAQNLKVGDELLGSDGLWQQVVDTDVQPVSLQAFNLTVDGFSTYFVSGDGSTAGVWVHNVCFDTKPDYFTERGVDTEFGHPVWKDPNSGEEVYEAWDPLTQKIRFYNRKDHPPTENFHEFDGLYANNEPYSATFKGLTTERARHWRDEIDRAGDSTLADDLRFQRYLENKNALGSEPLNRADWQVIRNRIADNQARGRVREDSARISTSNTNGVNDLQNNNSGNFTYKDADGNSANGPATFETPDGNTTRPDSIGTDADGNITVIHEHKDISGADPVVYRTDQIRGQQDAANDIDARHVLTISSDAGLGTDGLPIARPSRTFNEGNSNSDIYYFDPNTGRNTHQWGDGVWEEI